MNSFNKSQASKILSCYGIDLSKSEDLDKLDNEEKEQEKNEDKKEYGEEDEE